MAQVTLDLILERSSGGGSCSAFVSGSEETE